MVSYFKTVRDRKSSSRPHGWVHGMSRNKTPHHLGARASNETLCKIDTRRSSATAPAWVYLLLPCSRAHPCARGIPFIPQGTLSTSSWSHLVLNIKKGRHVAGPKLSHSWEVGDYLTALATGFFATFLAAGFLAAGFLAAGFLATALVVFSGLFIAVTLVARV